MNIVNWEKKVVSCPIHVVCFVLISNLLPNLTSNLISDFGIVSMLNHTINLNFDNKIYGMNNMEAIPQFDIKSVIKPDIKFDISIKPSTWIGHKSISWLVIDYLFWRNTLISFSTWPDSSAQYTFTFVGQRWTFCELCDYTYGKVVLHISF